MYMTPINPTRVSTDQIQIFAAYAGIHPLSSQYGYIIAFFEQKGHIYRIQYLIQDPNEDQASNYLTTIDEILFDCNGHYYTSKDTDFGHMVFWDTDTTPDEYLINEKDMSHYNLRMLQNKITKYVTEEDLVKTLQTTNPTVLETNKLFQ